MSIKAIIFDIGGVILWGAVPAFVPSDSPLIHAGKTSTWQQWDAGIIDLPIIKERLTAQYGDAKAVNRLIERVLDPERPFVACTVDAINQLKKRGYQLYVLSNFSWEAYNQFIKGRPSFFAQFEGIVCSCFIGITKPAPGIYTHLLTKYHLDAAECLFIDDSAENIAMAHRLGINAFLFNEKTFFAELERRHLLAS